MIIVLRRERAAAKSRPLSPERGVGIALLLGVPAVFWYTNLLLLGRSSLFAPVDHGLTFNSMLIHLLHGRFDVDPQTIGDEGSIRGGAIYVYFGILPALFRAVFLPLRNFSETDFTCLGCLVAVSLMATFKILSVLRVWCATSTSEGSLLLILFASAILFGGAQIEFLKPSIFQEVDFWADAIAAAFVYFALCGYFSDQGFTPGLVITLALLAGLCLQTRVSTALGLYGAFGLLWLQLAWRELCDAEPGHPRLSGVLALSASLLILLWSAAVTGFINYERWGSPLVFADPDRYLINLTRFPDRLAREHQYGLFNFIRFGYGLMYYFLPLWGFRGADGNLLWSAFQYRTIDTVELPPNSFFLSDPLLIGLAAYMLFHLIIRRDMPRPSMIIAILIGLLIPIILMFIAISMTYRYRIEFYPFFEFCAFVGFAKLLSSQPKRAKILFFVATIWCILISLSSWLLYKLSPFGPATEVLGHMDLISFYLSKLRF